MKLLSTMVPPARVGEPPTGRKTLPIPLDGLDSGSEAPATRPEAAAAPSIDEEKIGSILDRMLGGLEEVGSPTLLALEVPGRLSTRTSHDFEGREGRDLATLLTRGPAGPPRWLVLDAEIQLSTLRAVCGLAVSWGPGQAAPRVLLACSARLEELTPEPGESATDYAERVRSLLSIDGYFSLAREELDLFVDELAAALARRGLIDDMPFFHSETTIVRPTRNDLIALGARPFEQQRATLRDEPPPISRSAFCPDRYWYRFIDPIDTLLDLLALEALLEGRGAALLPEGAIRSTDFTLLAKASSIEKLADEQLSSVPALVSPEALIAYQRGHLPMH